MYDIRFIQPSTFLAVGPTSCGKTTLVNKIIRHKNALFDKPPAFVVYCYSQHQKSYEDLYNAGLVHKLLDHFPGFDEMKALLMPYKDDGGSLLILDDGLSSLSSDITRIFYELSHHANSSIIMTSQNLFYATKEYRTISLNTHYMFVFKNPRDKRQLYSLASQLSPYKPKFIVQSFQKATMKPYSYLLIDCHQSSPDFLRYRSRVIPGEGPVVVFLEKS